MDKKEAARQYKARKIPRGAFALRCKPTGEVWVDASPNLEAARNGAWFQLRLNSHRHKALQAQWNAHGEQAFEFEILETLDEDVAPLILRDLLKERKHHWASQLGATAIEP